MLLGWCVEGMGWGGGYWGLRPWTECVGTLKGRLSSGGLVGVGIEAGRHEGRQHTWWGGGMGLGRDLGSSCSNAEHLASAFGVYVCACACGCGCACGCACRCACRCGCGCGRVGG